MLLIKIGIINFQQISFAVLEDLMSKVEPDFSVDHQMAVVVGEVDRSMLAASRMGGDKYIVNAFRLEVKIFCLCIIMTRSL